MRRFWETMRLAKELNEEDVSENSSVYSTALGVTHLDTRAFLSTIRHGVLLHIEAAAVQTRPQKQTATFNWGVFCQNAPPLFQAVRSMYKSTCEKQSKSSGVSVLIELLQTQTISKPVKKPYCSAARVLFHDLADKKI